MVSYLFIFYFLTEIFGLKSSNNSNFVNPNPCHCFLLKNNSFWKKKKIYPLSFYVFRASPKGSTNSYF